MEEGKKSKRHGSMQKEGGEWREGMKPDSYEEEGEEKEEQETIEKD